MLAEAYHCRYNHQRPHRLSIYQPLTAFVTDDLASAVAFSMSSREVRGGVIGVLTIG